MTKPIEDTHIVTFKHRVLPGEEHGFLEAWRRCKRFTIDCAPGLREAVLLRSARDPRRFVTLTIWESRSAWEAYWGQGIPDPEGDPHATETWVQVQAVRKRP